MRKVNKKGENSLGGAGISREKNYDRNSDNTLLPVAHLTRTDINATAYVKMSLQKGTQLIDHLQLR